MSAYKTLGMVGSIFLCTLWANASLAAISPGSTDSDAQQIRAAQEATEKQNVEINETTNTPKNTQSSGTANPSNPQSTEKLFYDVCVKEMLQGMKEGIKEGSNQGAGHLMEDEKVLNDMKSISEDVCACAAPRYNKIVLSLLDKPHDDKMKKYFEQKAYETIMNCVAESKHPLLQKMKAATQQQQTDSKKPE